MGILDTPADAQPPVAPLAVSVKAACALLGIGNTTLWELIKDGRIETAKIGRRRLVIYESLAAFVARNRVAAP